MTPFRSTEFSRPEHWSGWPFLSPGDLPNPGIKLGSPALQADSLPTELSRKPITLNQIDRFYHPSTHLLLCHFFHLSTDSCSLTQSPAPFFLLPHSDLVWVPGKEPITVKTETNSPSVTSAIVLLRTLDFLSYSPKQLLQFLEILPKVPLHCLLPSSLPSTFSKHLSHPLCREARSRLSCPNSNFMDGDSCHQNIATILCSFFTLRWFSKSFKHLHWPHKLFLPGEYDNVCVLCVSTYTYIHAQINIFIYIYNFFFLLE